MACDFEAHGYCSGHMCRFWIQSLETFVNEQPILTQATAEDQELSLKIINLMLGVVEAEFSANLHILGALAAQKGLVDHQREKHTLEIALQTSAVLIWHCDETRTRALQPKHATWATTLNLVVKMDTRLLQYGAEVDCWSERDNIPASTHCDEIGRTLKILHMLILEFRRRSRWGISQCPALKKEL
jgi:hypothetical protein